DAADTLPTADVGADVVADTVAGDDTGDDTTLGPCEVALSEVDGAFVEAVVAGACDGWSLALRDATDADCAVSYEHFFAAGDAGRVAVDDLRVPATALVILRDATLRPVRAWAFGTCAPDASCVDYAGGAELEACLPADGAGGSVSRCGAQWVADKTPSPGGDNDCGCPVDCAAAAPQCQIGACVDGACVFDARPKQGGACDDDNRCTAGDRCEDGACVGELLACGPPPGPCALPGVCVPATGQCLYVDTCDDRATCTPDGCACLAGYRGDGTTCADVDECAEGTAGCDASATCVDRDGGFDCVCPLGMAAGADGRCVETSCDCPWEAGDACASATARLRVRVTDLWAQPLAGAQVAFRDTVTGRAIRAEAALAGWGFDEPLCAARSFSLAVSAADHHGLDAVIRWSPGDVEVDASASADAAWAVTWDDAGPVVWIGLAHRWFAASGRPARRDNEVALLMDGQEAWAAVRAALLGATSLVTGSTWWWTSELELVRDPATHATLSPAQRWANTILGTLEGLPATVERKLLVNQFLSQDGFFSDLTVDDELLAHAEAASDHIEYMGQANTAHGTFAVTPPVIDYGARVAGAHPDAGEPIDDGPADPFSPPIAVDMTALPLGLSLFELDLASWHQKFWTVDQRVAFVGGMNAKTTDWDTSAHRVFEPLRAGFDATAAERAAIARKEEESELGPRKDYMVRLEGPIVQDVVNVFHARWAHQLAAGVDYADRAHDFAEVPTTATFPGGLQAQLVATMPAPFDENAILETLLRAVSQARSLIYIEDQYFRAPLLYDRILARMAEVPGLEVVVLTNDVSEWTDPGCWQTHIAYERFHALYPERFRAYRLRSYDVVRTDCTFCFDETEAHFVDMDLHSKIVLVDDEYLEVGSCNSNNRGLLYEGELAVAVHDAAWVKAQRARILANLLGPGYDGAMPLGAVMAALDERARANQTAYDLWDDEWMDLDLDGDPIPAGWEPSGIVYPLAFDPPDECLLEGIGVDIM
ncbi:MAG: hypothetical protein KC635_23520, partial [Myxococcales bacterium]|nr:hypothetical protein [Myxococcales bacterium]